jgi:hypothetical protein
MSSRRRTRQSDATPKAVTSNHPDERLDAALEALRAPLAGDEVRVLVVGSDGAVTRSAHMTGGRPQLRDLEMAAAGAVLTVRDSFQYGEQTPAAQLTSSEEAVLAEGGFERSPAGHMRAADQGVVEYRKLLRESLTPQSVAQRLGVNESRIRQRLGHRQLLGVKDGRGWKLPRFQFDDARLVPGIDRVLPKVPPNLHPVAVQRWFNTPHPDLETTSGEPCTPLDWLGSGHDPAPVAALAAEL